MMIRFLQKSLVFTSICLATTFSGSAQSNLNIDTDTRSPEKILQSYGGLDAAVIHMTRPEWDIVRAWEGFDENEYLAALKKFKDSHGEKRKQLKEQRVNKVLDNHCGCWVEPDETYITLVPPPGLGSLGPNEVEWASQGGAGWDVDCSSPPIALPGWTFELYGSSYSEFYVNSKGMISFGGDVIDWTPTSFPEAEYNQITGYWQDTDNRSTGEIMYKVTQDAIYVNFVEVGYYNNHNDLTNNFQIIITPNDGIIGDGNNAQVCYLDMNWAHGDIGGGGGCCGPDPGVTGADQASTGSDGPHVQFGRFNLLDDTYNGPYGIGPGGDDGINWLDYKFFNLNTAVSSTNLPPVPTENIGCDTITICLTQSYDIGVNFLGPEPGQSVTLDVIPDLIGSNEITGFSVANGETASITGTFVGNEPGINTITINAIDDGIPASSTSVTMVIEVLDVLPPELTVEGNMAICAGSATEITALGAFDSFAWNINSQFVNDNVANIPFGGTFYVTGILDVGCQVQTSFFIDQSPYYLPDVIFDPSPPNICSDDSAYVEVVPAPDENFVGYTWEADWNGLGGEVYAETADGDGAWLSAGMYRLLVEDEAGCFGQRVFQIFNVDAEIPDITIPPMCSGLDTLIFEGGYASTNEGDLNIYLITSNNAGWEGSFINVIVNGEVSATITLTNSTFATFAVPIAFGDMIEIEYISANPANDALNQIQVYNCSNSGNETIITTLSSGTVFSSEAMCTVEEANGYWEETNGPGTSWFEYTDQYNTLWVPTEYGMYELCFYEQNCNIPYCYDVEVTLPPTISLNETEVFLCDGADILLIADTTDAGGTAEINWPYPGTDDVTENVYSYTQYTSTTIVVEIENGCGEDAASVDVTAYFAPLIDSMFLCDEEDEVEIDPIAADQNDDTSVYDWTWNGDPMDGEDEVVVSETGSYCVIVTNECFPEGAEDCGFVDIVSQIDDIFPQESGGAIADCDGEGIDAGETTTIELILPNEDYVATWPDGSTGLTWIIPEDLQATDAEGNLLWDAEGNPIWAYNGGDICVEVTDPYGCGSTEHCVFLYIGQTPTIDPEINLIDQIFIDPILLMCPEIPYYFNLNAIMPGPSSYSDFSWWTDCGGVNTYFPAGPDNTFVSSQSAFDDCWGQMITISGATETPCGGATMTQDVLIDFCEIMIPNVFTPYTGDDDNIAFEIEGLENYDDVLLRVFDRWGNLVYEDFDYSNDDMWYGAGSADGTYWFTLLLPNGIEQQGTVTIFRDR
jgi:gliding motility-associated-like protein